MSAVLPIPLTRFIGRARELSELRGRLPSDRLITLIGPGGSGKTRLALQLVSDQSLPVHWIDLSTVIDPDQVAVTVRHALGLGEHPDRAAIHFASFAQAEEFVRRYVPDANLPDMLEQGDH
jgi:predicted ATPase